MKTTSRSAPTSQRVVNACLIAFFALIALACGSSATDVADVSAPTTEPAVTEPAATEPASPEPASPEPEAATPLPEPSPTAEPTPTLLDEEFVTKVAEEVTPSLIDGFFLFATIDADGNPVTGATATGTVTDAPTATDAVPIGSITKVITSATVLTLVDDGIVDLDAPATEYVRRVAIPDGVTVRHLLQHRSGIDNYTDNTFFDEMMLTQSRVWTPEEIVETISDEPAGEPDSPFSYSNTNYIILGVLIEKVTGQPYHEAVRERLFAPLSLSEATYLSGFEEGPRPFALDADIDTTSIATSAWAAGAMLSSAADLHVFFTALFDGRLLSDESIAQMTDGDRYALGLEVDHQSDGLYGHTGFIGGYGSFIRHSPELGVTAFQSVLMRDPQGGLPAGLINDIVTGFRALEPS